METSAAPARTAERFQVTLSRDLGLFDVTMIGVGAMIGAGIFGLTGIAAGEAGALGLLVAFALNGVVTTMTGMTYAELGAARPQAGGGYAWVREGLSRPFGFYAGWISWFSHSVACSLYAVLFGTFFVELVKMAGLPIGHETVVLGLTAEEIAVKATATLAALAFIAINVRGSSETGAVGNVITTFKVVVLAILVVFGLRAMLNMPDWADSFLADPSPLPNGFRGVLLAMGLTFVAFEGYEIIAQSGEEVVAPERNIPRAIFGAIAIVVALYLSVAFVSIGALVQDTGVPNWVYLGENGERAMIETARAIVPYGALLMILGGLASTTSALNATIYSSSRVSFAMGRDRDLPTVFGRIHPRNRTPHWAIWLSGVLVIAMAVLLPVTDVASGASITFLLLFLMVNVTLIRLRRREPDMARPFRAPLVPWLQIVTIAVQVLLAVELVRLSPIAWAVTAGWLALGLAVYRRHGAAHEAAQAADMVLLEETVATRDYSVLLPVANEVVARQLARMGAFLARANGGEMFALHVVRVPRQIDLSDGRAFLRQGRPILDEVVAVGAAHDVPVRTMLRLGRDVGQSIVGAARERDANLMILGWPGTLSGSTHAFGSIIDVLSTNPPCDLAVVRLRRMQSPGRILVPVAGGPNARLAVAFAAAEADGIAEADGRRPEVVALFVVPASASDEEIAARRESLSAGLELAAWEVDLQTVRAEDVVGAILGEAAGFDQIVIGASGEGWLEQSLFGSIPQRVAEEATVTVVMVKRHDPVRFGLRHWLRPRLSRPASR